jgi:hypothetical protein
MPSPRVPTAALVAALLLPAALAAQGGVRVERRGPERVPAAAGSQVTLVFRVAVSAAGAVDAVPEPGLPAGWRLLAAEAPLRLSPGAAETRLLAVAVPDGAAAGVYAVHYAVRAGGSRAQDSVVVEVAVRRRVEARVQDAPRFAPAGAGYAAAFELRNAGNAPLRLALSVRGDHGLAARLDAAELTLAPAETRVVRATVAGGGARDARFTHVVTLAARLPGDSTAAASAASRVEIVPVSGASGGRRQTLPAELRLRSRGAGGGPAIVPALSASGPVAGPGSAQVDLLLQAADQRPGVAGENSVYRLAVAGRGWDVALGDQAFALTRLTEPAAYGFGAGGRVEGRWASLAGFAARDRRGPGGSREAGGTLGLGPAWARVEASWLSRAGRDSGTVRSLGARVAPFRGAEARVEAARSEGGGGAVTARIEYASPTVTASARHLDVDPGFTGRERGAREDAASVRVRTPAGLRAEARLFRRSEGTVFVGPAAGLSSTRERADAALGWKSLATLRWADERRTGTLFGGVYDRRARSLSAEATLRAGRLWLRPGVEEGVGTDLLGGDEEPFRRTWVQAGAAFRGGSYLSAGVRAQEGRGAAPVAPPQGWTGSVDGGLSLAGATTLRVSAQATRYPAGGTVGLVDVAVSQGLPFGQRVVARTRAGVGAQPLGPARSTSSVDYVIPVAVPVPAARRPGTASGRVYEAETGRGVAGVPVRVGGRVALTDARGRWAVAGLADGAHAVEPDRLAAGIDRVPAAAGADTLRVAGGRSAPLQTPLVRSAAVAGTLRLPAEGSPAGVVLLLTSGGATLRRAVDAAGSFRFADLRPGRWTLSADAGTLPPHHVLRGGEVALDLAAGSARTLELALEETRRPVLIVAEAEVSVHAPSASPRGAPAAAPAEEAGVEETAVEYDEVIGTYTVMPGDAGLVAISYLVYATGELWPRLWLANRDRVPDPARLEPGLELRIPAPGPLTPAEREVARRLRPPARR